MPKPTPSPGASPSAPAPSLPPRPTYQGAAATSSPGSTSNPDDIFSLGKLYDLPVYLGTMPTDQGSTTGEHSGGGHYYGSSPQFGTTEEFFKSAKDLWEQQTSERKAKPDQLTGYEQLQQELWAAGFYGQTTYDAIHVGQWTSQTEDAIKNALGAYERVVIGKVDPTGQPTSTPMTFTEFLQQNQQMGADGGQTTKQGAGARAPKIPHLTDPAQIRQAAQNAAMNALGMGLTQQQLDAFVTQFQNEQSTRFEDAQGNGYTESSKLVSEADAYAQQANPTAYKQNQQAAYMDALVNLFAGPGATNRPNIAPTPAANGVQSATLPPPVA